MTEQFGFQQVFRDRPAVDGDKRLVAPVARIVQPACQKLLAGTTRTEQHDRNTGIRHPLNRACHFQHLGRCGDDRPQQLFAASIGLLQLFILHFERTDMKRPPDNEMEFIYIHRLLIKIPRTRRNRTQRTFARTVPRCDDDLGIGLQLEHFIERGKSLTDAIWIRRQPEVEGHYIRLFGPQQCHGFFAGCGAKHLKVFVRPFKLFLQPQIVFDYQQFLSVFGH